MYMTLNNTCGKSYYCINESSNTGFDTGASRLGRTGNSLAHHNVCYPQERPNLAKILTTLSLEGDYQWHLPYGDDGGQAT